MGGPANSDRRRERYHEFLIKSERYLAQVRENARRRKIQSLVSSRRPRPFASVVVASRDLFRRRKAGRFCRFDVARRARRLDEALQQQSKVRPSPTHRAISQYGHKEARDARCLFRDLSLLQFSLSRRSRSARADDFASLLSSLSQPQHSLRSTSATYGEVVVREGSRYAVFKT